ncbi:MAG: glycerol-3-phosphate 1-O-acyltransferase PlsY [Dehalococcoidia bacterium]|nr:glycerol-3-phosphate 1-O-acyltransferase PlsY [Dehalococcoidia bacterium]
MIGQYAANILIGYLFGSVPTGLVVGYLWLRKDIRTVGSGKTGTTNVLRTAGKLAAGIVLLVDVSKGAVPALLGRYVFDDDGVAAAGAAAAIVGHVWPVFAGFRGGRGVASAFGGVLGLAPLVSLAFPVVALVLVVSTRYMSFMSVVGTPIAAGIVIALSLTGHLPGEFALYAAFAVLLVEYTHIPNIRRLLAGTEPRLGQGGDRPATG